MKFSIIVCIFLISWDVSLIGNVFCYESDADGICLLCTVYQIRYSMVVWGK